MKIKIKRLREGIKLPEYKTSGAVGLDVYCTEDENVWPGNTRLIPLGFSVEVPESYELQVRSRSGLSLSGITVANSPGTIDPDYRGEVCVILHNNSTYPAILRKGERIAQLVLAKTAPKVEWEEVDSLTTTDRGEGGFGHTGKGD